MSSTRWDQSVDSSASDLFSARLSVLTEVIFPDGGIKTSSAI